MAEDTKDPAPPYISFKTFKNFLAGLKAGIPARIDRSVMPSYSGAVQAQLLHTLRYLNLIKPTGHPTEKLAVLVNSEGAERQRHLAALVAEGYPFLFHDDFNIGNATSSMLADQFTKRATGETVRKCINFLLPLMKEAGITVSPHIKGPPRRTNGGQRSKKKSADPQQVTPAPTSQAEQPKSPPVMAWAELLLSKFPSFDPAWPDDVKSKWFASFEKLMASGAGKGEAE